MPTQNLEPGGRFALCQTITVRAIAACFLVLVAGLTDSRNPQHVCGQQLPLPETDAELLLDAATRPPRDTETSEHPSDMTIKGGTPQRLQTLSKELQLLAAELVAREKHTQLLADCLRGRTFLRVPGIEQPVEMLFVPPRKFTLGLTLQQQSRLARISNNPFIGHHCRPDLSAELTQGYFMARTEVTHQQWAAWCLATGQSAAKPNQNLHAPVTGVSWEEATQFCEWLSEQTGFAVRLPTEIEWEFAARGPDGDLFASTEPSDAEDVQPRASWIGMSSMADGVAEWCRDQYQRDLFSRLASTLPEDGTLHWDPAAFSDGDAATSSALTERSYRGGTDTDPSWHRQFAMRRALEQSARRSDLGFRIVLIPSATVPPAETP